METCSALLAIGAGNSPVPGEFPAQRPVTRSFDVIFDLRLNKRLRKQSRGWWFETLSCPLWRHCNDTTSKDSTTGAGCRDGCPSNDRPPGDIPHWQRVIVVCIITHTCAQGLLHYVIDIGFMKHDHDKVRNKSEFEMINCIQYGCCHGRVVGNLSWVLLSKVWLLVSGKRHVHILIKQLIALSYICADTADNMCTKTKPYL